MVWKARLQAMSFLVSISKGEMPSRQPAGRPGATAYEMCCRAVQAARA